MFRYAVIIFSAIIITACNTTPSKPVKFTNDRYKSMPPEQGKAVFHRDEAACRQLALKNVPMPRTTYRPRYRRPQPQSYGVYNSWGNQIGSIRPENSSPYGGAPSLMPMFEAMEMERNNPRNIYRSSVSRYIGSCMLGKGWERT